jgi:hypothetical protein
MKVLKTVCFTLLFCCFTLMAHAQVKIGESSLVTQLFDLNKCDTLQACKFYTDKHYPLILHQTLAQPAYSLTVYKYKPAGQLNSYLLSAIKGQIVTAGYITYQGEEYLAIMKTIIGMGFRLNEDAGAGTTKMVYLKDNFSFIAEKKMAGSTVFYVVALSDLAKTEGLMGK